MRTTRKAIKNLKRKPSSLNGAMLVAFALIVLFYPAGLALAQSPPTGPAGGDLTGTYPSPGLAVDRVRKTGDTIAGQLNITLPNAGGLVYPFSLSSGGNAGPNRGIAFQFNLPANPSAVFGAQMTAARESWGLSSYFSFSTHNGTAVAEALRIAGNGNVGIGTATPGYKLDVNGNLNIRGGVTYFRQSSGLAGGEGAYVAIGATANNEASLSLNVYRGGVYTPRFVIDNYGRIALQPNGDANVGIGISAPNYRLDVQGGAVNASGGLCIAGDCKTAWSQVVGGGGSQWTTAGSAIHYNTGNVGIGTAAPLTKLQVAGGTRVDGTNGRVYLGTIAATGARGLEFLEENATTFSIRHHDPAVAWRNIVINPHGGNVGIGTIAPGAKLDVTGTVRVGNADTNLGNHPTYGTTYSALWRQGADYSLLTNGASTFLNAPTATGNIHFRSANADKMFLQGATGNVGIGTTAPTVKLDVAGTINATALTVNGTPVAGSQWTNSGSNINYAAGKVGIGTANPTVALDVTGDIKVSGNISAKYQDLAEWVPATNALPAGTVVTLDPTKSNHVEASSQAYDTRVAGVISAQPGIALGERGENKVLVATTGRVKIKVDASQGPIQVGDLLVTSDVAGVAMKSQPLSLGGVQIHRPGTLIGKALEPLAKGQGEILVLLSLQ